SITGGKDLMLFEVDEAATRIREEADPDANIIVGASFDESLEGIVRVSVVATGIDNLDPARQIQPAQSSLTELAERLRNDSSRTADLIERSTPPPEPESLSLRPTAHPEGRPATPISEYARHAAPQELDPFGRSFVRNSIEKVLDIPAFLRRKAS
ncbi:MAG: cell division protein FtsZ, partial [Acetobacteraceae bacterium]|nr:cell division protein FtsZ [Acetobacteraceae bacterium]